MNISKFNKPVKPAGALANLTEAQCQQLDEWLNSDRTYKETKDLVKTTFGIHLNSTSALKQFRKQYCIPLLRTLAYCPPFIPREAWEFSLAEMVKALRNSKTKIETRVRISAFLLQVARMSIEQNKLSAKSRGPKRSKAKAIENKPVEEPNPLDDDDKLDEIRRQVFGAAINPDSTQ